MLHQQPEGQLLYSELNTHHIPMKFTMEGLQRPRYFTADLESAGVKAADVGASQIPSEPAPQPDALLNSLPVPSLPWVELKVTLAKCE